MPAARLCGSAIADLKKLTLSPWGANKPDEDNNRHEFIKTERFGVRTVLNLTEFDSIESLVLLGMDHQNPCESVLIKIDMLVALLPKLRDLSIRIAKDAHFGDIDEMGFLEDFFSGPVEPLEREVALTISVALRPDSDYMSTVMRTADIRSLSEDNVDMFCFREFQRLLVGEHSAN